jgi:O-antigen biosynthesis protein
MATRVKVMDLELSQPLPEVRELSDYSHLQFLLRWHGTPLGCVKIPVVENACSPGLLRDAILRKHTEAWVQKLLRNALLAEDPPRAWTLPELLTVQPQRKTSFCPPFPSRSARGIESRSWPCASQPCAAWKSNL